MPPETSSLALNCSRIGFYGGLKTFAVEVMLALQQQGYAFRAVVPAGFVAPAGVATVPTPASLAGSSRVSRWRPLKWYGYSRFQFPIPPSQRVLCTTHHVLPGRGNQIVTVHDLRPYFFPDTPVQNFYFRHILPRALKRCDGVLTVSETSRQLIADIYKVPHERIRVVPNVIASPHEPPSAPEATAPYLLTVGASWPHKNIEPLLRSAPLWAHRYTLTIVAGEGQYRTQLEQLAQQLGIAHRVRFFGSISSQQLEQLYRGCSALIAPSLMEGFGLPPLEAMARRRPVIVADIPVFRELYGEHALYVGVEQPASWEQAFAALPLLSDDQLAAAQLHALSYNRARMQSALREALHAFWNL